MQCHFHVYLELQGDCLQCKLIDRHVDGLVGAQLRVTPHGAHLYEEAHDVVHGGVSFKQLLRLPVLNHVKGVGAFLPIKLIGYKPRLFLKNTKENGLRI